MTVAGLVQDGAGTAVEAVLGDGLGDGLGGGICAGVAVSVAVSAAALAAALATVPAACATAVRTSAEGRWVWALAGTGPANAPTTRAAVIRYTLDRMSELLLVNRF